MSEIYRDKTGQALSLGVTGASQVSATFSRNGESIEATVSGTNATIPYSIVVDGGEVIVEWTYTVEGQEYKRLDSFTVVTPLFTQAELNAYDTQFSALTSNQVIILERFVRMIIEAYTGQSFGQERGKQVLFGNGTSVLQSPKRIISLDGSFSSSAYKIVGGGYGVEVWRGVIPTGSIIGNLDGGPIYDPYPYSGGGSFRNNFRYEVSGVFGWPSVPEEVKQAALILAGEFSCNEATWRDRYIKSIRAADWRFDFNSQAFSGTGSVSADALLSKYIVSRMAVI
jgi:hypothetical protein